MQTNVGQCTLIMVTILPWYNTSGGASLGALPFSSFGSKLSGTMDMTQLSTSDAAVIVTTDAAHSSH